MRTEERGILDKNAPPLPVPLLHLMEERENTSLPGGFETVSPTPRYQQVLYYRNGEERICLCELCDSVAKIIFPDTARPNRLVFGPIRLFL